MLRFSDCGVVQSFPGPDFLNPEPDRLHIEIPIPFSRLDPTILVFGAQAEGLAELWSVFTAKNHSIAAALGKSMKKATQVKSNILAPNVIMHVT